ncbi:hypothetical protein [Herbaspirillum sp.]|uniref:hypothetical protein n=1 Tax=Herbaspirillum sp. TaxID=1890675 RepID=UPI001B2D4F4F|nr:hypothetical protein [Herbaspirillum sp.]MBO9536715.1 hypothetical protein [Herbaspirillum sp.]
MSAVKTGIFREKFPDGSVLPGQFVTNVQVASPAVEPGGCRKHALAANSSDILAFTGGKNL